MKWRLLFLLVALVPGSGASGEPSLAGQYVAGSGMITTASGDAARHAEAVHLSLAFPRTWHDPALQSFDTYFLLRVLASSGLVSAQGAFQHDARGRNRLVLDPTSLSEELDAAFFAWCEQRDTPEACSAARAMLEPRLLRSVLRLRAGKPETTTIPVRLRGRIVLALVDPASDEVVFPWQLAFRSGTAFRSLSPSLWGGFSAIYFNASIDIGSSDPEAAPAP